jgi:hypothetical protein
MSEIKQKQWMVIESGLGWVVPSIEKKNGHSIKTI